MIKRREDFELIRQQIDIETVANYLLEKQGKNYVYPDEKTASIKLYLDSNSFFDFGRGVGGDCIKLWTHICRVDGWTALQQIRATFALDRVPNKKYNQASIRQQEKVRHQQIEAKKQQQVQWVREIERLKAECSLYQALLESEYCKPLSWLWCICRNRLTVANGKLDLLCGI